MSFNVSIDWKEHKFVFNVNNNSVKALFELDYQTMKKLIDTRELIFEKEGKMYKNPIAKIKNGVCIARVAKDNKLLGYMLDLRVTEQKGIQIDFKSEKDDWLMCTFDEPTKHNYFYKVCKAAWDKIRKKSQNPKSISKPRENMRMLDKAIVFLTYFPNEEEITVDDINQKYPEMINKMKRGDLVENAFESGYRSQGIYGYDGSELVDLETDYDPYGTPPNEFKLIEEFPPGYWDDPIQNNEFEPNIDSQFYWHSEYGLSKINLNNFDCTHELATVKEEQYDHSTKSNKMVDIKLNHIKFTHNDKKYLVVTRGESDTKEIIVCTGGLRYVTDSDIENYDYVLGCDM
jgi:hypothetical protein